MNLAGIWQAAYTAGVVLPKPVATATYYHRALQPKKLVAVNFTKLAVRAVYCACTRPQGGLPNVSCVISHQKKCCHQLCEPGCALCLMRQYMASQRGCLISPM